MRALWLLMLVVGVTAGLLGCGSEAGSGTVADSTASGAPEAAAAEWQSGLYYLDNWNNLQGYRLVMVLAESHGKRTVRLALHGGVVYYLCLPIEFEPFGGSGGKFDLVRAPLVPEWNGKPTLWLFPEGEAKFTVTGTGNERLLNLTIKSKRFELKYGGDHWMLPYQATLMSAAGASRAEHLFLQTQLPDSTSSTANIIRGVQEYDKRHSPIEVEVIDRSTGLCRVRMKNFLYSPMSTSETETRVYKGKLIKSRSDFGGYDLVVDFGEGREVRYEVTVK
jgi:hypothetical protein